MLAHSDQSEHTHLEPHQPVSSFGWSVLIFSIAFFISVFNLSSMIAVVFDGTPQTRIDIKATSGALDGEASAKGMSVFLKFF